MKTTGRPGQAGAAGEDSQGEAAAAVGEHSSLYYSSWALSWSALYAFEGVLSMRGMEARERVHHVREGEEA